ncbi:MAG: type II toxin-antitoxin system RelE/ParE family toxin [Nitrospiraceae bacterium]|nr:type II toxin-antitoxin system RelE/ParE family toxin [Nitrospiraceae bacterium]
MPYELLIERRAEKDLKKLQVSLFTVVIEKIKSLSENSHPAGSRKLSGSQNDWRIRIGDYRVLYEIDNKTQTIKIMRVKHRREVYRDDWS